MLKKGIFIFICIFFISGYFLWNQKKSSNKKNLKILTYSSFIGVYGPGRFLQKEFEKNCQCKIQWFLAEDSTHLLQRAHMISDLDLVIGFDQMLLREARKFKWKKIQNIQVGFSKEVSKWKDDFFIPMDWAPIGFLIKNQRPEIYQLKQLGNIRDQMSFPEPKTSTLGLQFYYWIYEVFSGDIQKIKKFLNQIKPRIYGPTFSWSVAYGYFQKDRVSMSLSYLTSLIYHRREEKNSSYRFAYFKEGHPYQIEFSAVPASCHNCSLAFDFIQFLLQPSSQKIIGDRNYMFPATNRISTTHSYLKIPSRISYNQLNEFLNAKPQLLKMWKDILY